MVESYNNKLSKNEIKVGIWGGGFIGFTSAANFAFRKINVLVYDINQEVVDGINRGYLRLPQGKYWIGFPLKPLLGKDFLKATSNLEDMMQDEVIVHLVAVPTEKNGTPCSDALVDVFEKICKRKKNSKYPDVIIIESTISVKDIEVILNILKVNNKKLGKDILFGVAPRRDWFFSKEKNLKNLPRIYAGYSERDAKVIKSILSIICDTLIEASDIKVAVLTKAVENSLLHIPAVFSMQLSLAYPDVDIVEVLKLASTHWRIPYYYPSMATGGACVPVAGKYLKAGAVKSDELTIIDEALKTDGKILNVVAKKILKKEAPIGVLGVTYKGDLKVHIMSPSLKIIDILKQRGLDVFINDPYYSSDELKEITGVDTFNFPEDLNKFNTIIIVPSHKLYVKISRKELFKYLSKGQKIYDNVGTWCKFKKYFSEVGIRYIRIGGKDWLK